MKNHNPPIVNKQNSSLIFFIYFLIVFPAFSQEYSQTGKASFYADKYENRRTASGEKYKHSRMTAAHKSLSEQL